VTFSGLSWGFTSIKSTVFPWGAGKHWRAEELQVDIIQGHLTLTIHTRISEVFGEQLMDHLKMIFQLAI
jgi:hypothetical protein